MPTTYEMAFIDRLATMDDEALLRMLQEVTSAPAAYRPDAVAAVRAEVARRHLGEARQRQAEERVRQEEQEALQADANQLAFQGQSVEAIVAHLKTLGVTRPEALAMAERAWQAPADVRKRAGWRNLAAGCALVMLSPVATLVAWQVVDGGERIRLLVPKGALFVAAIGLFQGLRGLAQLTSRGPRN